MAGVSDAISLTRTVMSSDSEAISPIRAGDCFTSFAMTPRGCHGECQRSHLPHPVDVMASDSEAISLAHAGDCFTSFAATVIKIKGEKIDQAGEKRQTSPFRTNELIMTNNLRIQAVRATIFSLPRLSKD